MPRGRKIMKGGDWTDYFNWTGWSNSNENSSQYSTAYSILFFFVFSVTSLSLNSK